MYSFKSLTPLKSTLVHQSSDTVGVSNDFFILNFRHCFIYINIFVLGLIVSKKIIISLITVLSRPTLNIPAIGTSFAS